MSGWCIAQNQVNNSSSYTFLNPQFALSSGHWNISPQPIPTPINSLLAFQAQGASGTATGAVGTVTYGAYAPSTTGPATNPSGTVTLNFSDPYDGDNSCTCSTTVPNLSVVPSYNQDGRTCYISWTITSPLLNGMIVQVPGNDAQYLVLMGQTCLIPNPATVTNLFTTAAAANVVLITQSQFNSFPSGPALTDGASLAQLQGQPQFYLLTWGQACWIASVQVFTEYGFNPAMVQTVTSLPPLGITISS
jgi:hypothetical protein